MANSSQVFITKIYKLLSQKIDLYK